MPIVPLLFLFGGGAAVLWWFSSRETVASVPPPNPQKPQVLPPPSPQVEPRYARLVIRVDPNLASSVDAFKRLQAELRARGFSVDNHSGSSVPNRPELRAYPVVSPNKAYHEVREGGSMAFQKLMGTAYKLGIPPKRTGTGGDPAVEYIYLG